MNGWVQFGNTFYYYQNGVWIGYAANYDAQTNGWLYWFYDFRQNVWWFWNGFTWI